MIEKWVNKNPICEFTTLKNGDVEVRYFKNAEKILTGELVELRDFKKEAEKELELIARDMGIKEALLRGLQRQQRKGLG